MKKNREVNVQWTIIPLKLKALVGYLVTICRGRERIVSQIVYIFL